MLDGSTCELGELLRAANWLAQESAGQCGPCRFGLPAMARDMAAVFRGQARGGTELRRHASVVSGRGACAHPDGAVRFLSSGLEQLAFEVRAHQRFGTCGRNIRGLLPLGSAR